MSFVNPAGSRGPLEFSQMPEHQCSTLDTQSAREAYLSATERPLECHVQVGVLLPAGGTLEARLGKDEDYGAHRVGSVTKTFTTFLALKLANDGVIALDTKCGTLIDRKILNEVFVDPDAAAEMTLDQLLSHTSGLEYDDHLRSEKGLDLPTMDARFRLEGKAGKKYKHTSQPGDRIGSYSNAGLAVAAWMMERAYNFHKQGNELPLVSFAEIMKEELFSKVFGLSDDSRIAPGPSGDVIGAAAGDMTSSVRDLLKVAHALQQGEKYLEKHFGSEWHQTMLAPRDRFEHHGIGCAANQPSIQHAGLNYEIFEHGIGRDVTALVIFPLNVDQPGLVAMCDSNALGPLPKQIEFQDELKKMAGLEVKAKPADHYELSYFCPNTKGTQVFHGDAYVVTDVDPFAEPAPPRITLSRNGMKHDLLRDPALDMDDAIGYRDANKKPWMAISKGERKMIYSDYCLASAAPQLLESLTNPSAQPSTEQVRAIAGVYKDPKNPEEPVFSFKEEGGRLYFQEGIDKTYYPALYLPHEDFWAVSLPSGRRYIKFRFPNAPDSEPLVILDISKKIESPTQPITGLDRLPPYNNVRR